MVRNSPFISRRFLDPALILELYHLHYSAKDAAGNQLYLTPTKKCVLSWTCPTGYYPDGCESSDIPRRSRCVWF